MKATKEVIAEAAALIRQKSFGVLSTMSVALDGHPFGSLISYCMDRKGRPMCLLSTIAQHTKNIEADNRCSLTILEAQGGDVQAQGRITISGRMHLTDDKDDTSRYLRHFPESERYMQFHDFSHYVIEVEKYRYIGGFGRIHWIEPDELSMASPFDRQTEEGMVNHMNKDHAQNIRSYFKLMKEVIVPEEDEVKMCGIDARGFDVLWREERHRFETEPMLDAKSARTVLVDLAQRAQALS